MGWLHSGHLAAVNLFVLRLRLEEEDDDDAAAAEEDELDMSVAKTWSIQSWQKEWMQGVIMGWTTVDKQIPHRTLLPILIRNSRSRIFHSSCRDKSGGAPVLGTVLLLLLLDAAVLGVAFVLPPSVAIIMPVVGEWFDTGRSFVLLPPPPVGSCCGSITAGGPDGCGGRRIRDEVGVMDCNKENICWKNTTSSLEFVLP